MLMIVITLAVGMITLAVQRITYRTARAALNTGGAPQTANHQNRDGNNHQDCQQLFHRVCPL